MKKFFTLIAAVMMAVGAMAQVQFTVTDTPKGGVTASAGTMTMTWGNDTGEGVAWKDNKAASKTVTIGGKSYSFSYQTQGTNNPQAMGVDNDGNPAKVNPTADNCVPVSGAYVSFKATTNGVLNVVVVVNADKPIWVVEDGAVIDCVVNGAPLAAMGKLTAKSDPGIITIDIKANSTYYVFCTGSKMGYYGFVYTEGEAKKEAPQISIPSDMTAYVGATATLTPTNVSGSPAPSIQWYSNTSASNQGGTAIEGATSASLSITPEAEGTLYYYAVATNSEGSKTSNCCTVTVIDPNIYVSEADEIYFNEIEEGNPNGLNFIGGALKLTVTSTDGKMVIASNGQNFGTPEESFKCEKRLDTGGKTVSTNKLVLNSQKAGKLYIYARADARQIVIKQDGATLLSQMLNESDATRLPKDDGTESVYYPIYSVDVAAGDIDVEFPDGRIYIYGFSLDGLITSIENVNVAAPVAPAKKSLRNGQIVIETANGTFNAVGAQVK